MEYEIEYYSEKVMEDLAALPKNWPRDTSGWRSGWRFTAPTLACRTPEP